MAFIWEKYTCGRQRERGVVEVVRSCDYSRVKQVYSSKVINSNDEVDFMPEEYSFGV